VYCGQTVGWIKIKLGTEVGLGPGYIVLDGDPAPPKGAQPTIFGPCLLWPNGWMDQDAILYGCRPWPMWHCVRCGPGPPRKGAQQPQFSANFALARSPISATAELLFAIPPCTAEIMSTNVSCNNLYYCQITKLVIRSSQLQSYEFSSNSVIR